MLPRLSKGLESQRIFIVPKFRFWPIVRSLFVRARSILVRHYLNVDALHSRLGGGRTNAIERDLCVIA